MIFRMMLIATTMTMTSCSTEDPFSNYENNWGGSDNNTDWANQSGGSSTTTGDLTTFAVTIDQTTAEPSTTATAYLPDEEDALENNSFTTEIAIDLSNPAAKTESGVEISVSGGHITANHGSAKGICYVLSGTTANGSFTVVGDKKYEVKLNGASITNPDSAALNLLSGKRAFVVLADGTSNSLTDGTSGSQKGALYCKGKLLFSGSGALSVTGHTNNAIQYDLNNIDKAVCIKVDSFIDLYSIQRNKSITSLLINLMIHLGEKNKDIMQYNIYTNIEKFLCNKEKKKVLIQFK